MKKVNIIVGAIILIASFVLPSAAFANELELKTADEKIIVDIEESRFNDEELADLTILGVFGNGKERKELFEKYDIEYDKVQGIVNDKIIELEWRKPVKQVQSVESNKKSVKKSVKRVEKAAPKKVASKPTSATYSLRDLQFHGVINWGGYKFTYYSQRV